jgi:hypothetical protein
VGPRFGLLNVEKTKITCHAGNRTPAVEPIAIPTELSESIIVIIIITPVHWARHYSLRSSASTNFSVIIYSIYKKNIHVLPYTSVFIFKSVLSCISLEYFENLQYEIFKNVEGKS